MKISSTTFYYLKASLAEDVGAQDITSELLVPRKAEADALVVAREGGVFCGEAVVHRLLRFADPRLKGVLMIRDGRSFQKGRRILRLHGETRSILKVERTLLNFLAHLCGIATLTRRFAERTRKYGVSILDTRKTTPLWRELEKYAVRVGGGRNHRTTLADQILVKENHRPSGDLSRLRPFRRRFIIEVRNLRELYEALPLQPRAVLFDNFSPRALGRAVRLARKIDPKVILEASGGVTLQNVSRYAATGIDRISIGALTHSAKAVNLSLLLH